MESLGLYKGSDGIYRRKVIPDARKQLMLAVMDGETNLSGTMHILNQYRHCDAFLRWLIHNRLTGNVLIEMIRETFHSDVHALANFIVLQSKKDRTDADRTGP